MADTENSIASIYRETKDIPFVISIENAASVRKCESIINKLLKSINKSNIGNNFFQAVPIIFSSGYECCDELLHLEIDKEDMTVPFGVNCAQFNFYYYFRNIGSF